MRWWKLETNAADRNREADENNRRKDPRIGGQFKVRYSATHGDEIIMGHATVVDLCRYGFGLNGARGLKLGMELALFLELSDRDEPLCIPETFVTWIDGRRFGVELRAAREKEPAWLEFLAG
ncbi:MAG: hypothetical protein OEU87_07900 [Nitrospira sp.]|nr:hypothetical protein [Nitrospira sp.]